MAQLISSVIHRYLRAADAFVDVRKSLVPIPFEAGQEEVVGWYQNPPPWDRLYVVFTTVALYSIDSELHSRIAYDEIDHYEGPASKSDVSGIKIRTHSGEEFVRFGGRSGPSGQFSDAFALASLLRVIVLVNRRRR